MQGIQAHKQERAATKVARLSNLTGAGCGRLKLFPSRQRGWLGGLLLLAGLLMALRAPAQLGTPAPDGLIGWWSGDGSANDLVSTNNGSLLGGATATTPGVVGTAFLLDGTNSYVSIPNSTALQPTNMTIEAWVRCDLLDTPTTTSYPGQEYIVFKQNAQMANFEGFDLAKDREPRGTLTTTNDTWCFEETTVAGENLFVESITTVKTNVWYHVAGVRGPNYIAIYVNGVLESNLTVNAPLGYGTEPMYFGTTGQTYWDHKFGGALDEVSMYNRALSSNEIYAIYAAGPRGKIKTPTAYAMGMSNAPAPASQNFPALTVAGITGQTFGIQAVSSLPAQSNQWVGLTNLTLLASTNVWVDPSPASDAQRFYRVVPGTISVP